METRIQTKDGKYHITSQQYETGLYVIAQKVEEGDKLSTYDMTQMNINTDDERKWHKSFRKDVIKNGDKIIESKSTMIKEWSVKYDGHKKLNNSSSR